MTGDYEALLAACFADPGDDLARLVFADYLEEHRDTDWARLIRLQIERSRLGRTSYFDEEVGLVRRFWAAHPRTQYCDISEYPKRGFWTCGTEHIDQFPSESWPESLLNLFRAGRVESVTIGHPICAETLPARAVEFLRMVGEVKLARSACESAGQMLPLVGKLVPGEAGTRLKRLTVPEEYAADFERLLADDTLGGARIDGGDVTFADPTPRAVSRQIADGAFREAERVEVRERLTPELAALIASCPDLVDCERWFIFDSLTLTAESAAAFTSRCGWVGFHNVTWAAGAADAWLAADWVRAAKRIQVVETAPFNQADLARFLGRDYPNLEHLAVDCPGPLPELAGAPALRKLNWLSLPQCATDPLEAIRLRLDPATRHIGQLWLAPGQYQLATNEATGELRVAIGPRTESAWPPEAATLDWSEVGEVAASKWGRIHTGWFATLAACFPNGLRTLDLERTGSHSGHAKALAAALPTLKPKRLYLGDNRLGLQAVRALLKSGGLGELDVLDLSANPITRKVLDQIAASCPVKLRRLVLRDIAFDMTDNDRERFQARLGRSVAVEW